MARYFTKQSVEESVALLNSDPEHLELATLLTGTIVLRALDDSAGNDVMITYNWDKGRIKDWTLEAEAAPSSLRDRPFAPIKDGIARITANYQTFVKLDRQEMEPEDTLDSPDYKIEGHKLMILPLMQAVTSWNRVVRSMAKEY